jgi:hypothetical protein
VQVNPHIMPFLKYRRFWNSRVMRLVYSEVCRGPVLLPPLALPLGGLQKGCACQITYRLDQLTKWGWLPASMANMRTVLNQKYVGHITIMPDVTNQDYLRCGA